MLSSADGGSMTDPTPRPRPGERAPEVPPARRDDDDIPETPPSEPPPAPVEDPPPDRQRPRGPYIVD